jgi:hypothetical protein
MPAQKPPPRVFQSVTISSSSGSRRRAHSRR